MVHRVVDRRFSVKVLVGMTIATIGLELPVLAVPQPSPLLVSPVACKVSKTTPVYKTANTGNSEALMRSLLAGTLVGLAGTLLDDKPARVQIDQPSNGFVDYAALDCGRTPTVPPPGPQPNPPLQKTSACRKVRNTVISMAVRQEPSRRAAEIDRVGAGQIVYVTQTGGATTSRPGANGEVWVEVDLQRTFPSMNFDPSLSFGWLSNSEPGDQRTTLVDGCR